MEHLIKSGLATACFCLCACQTLEPPLAVSNVDASHQNKTASPKPTFHKEATFAVPALNSSWPVQTGSGSGNVGHLLLGGGTRTAASPFKHQITVSAGPVIKNRTLFLGDEEGQIHALSSATASVLWTSAMPAESSIISLAATEEFLVATAENKRLVSLSLKTRKPLWSVELDARATGNLITHAGRVYVAMQSGKVAAYHLHDGKVAWSVDLEGGRSTLVLSGSTLTVQTETSGLFALDGASGTTLWQNRTKTEVDAQLLQTKDRLFLKTDKDILILSSKSGARLNILRNVDATRFSVSGSSLFAIAPSNHLQAYDTKSGELLWSAKLPARQSANGQKHWSQPLLAGGRLHITDNTGYVASYGASDGSLLKLRDVGSAIVNGPAVVNGRMHLVTRTGNIIRF